MELAINERIFYVRDDQDKLVRPIRPVEPHVYMHRCGDIRKRYVALFPRLHPWTVDKFTLSYDGPKRVLYQRAGHAFNTRGVQRDDGNYRTFMKREKHLKSVYVPRVINPRSPIYNVAIGRFIKEFECHSYRLIDKMYGATTCIKGYNAERVGSIFLDAWNQFSDPVAVGLDAKRFDQHVSVQALEYEHSILNRVFRDPQLRLWLSWQIRNRGSARCFDGKIKYRVDGGRGSGDMNTSSGNYLLMSHMLLSWLENIGISGKCRVLCCGDDVVVITNRSHLHTFTDGFWQWMSDFGFDIKIEDPVYYLEHIEFCQSVFVRVGNSALMVRKPLRAISKDCTSLLPIRSRAAFNSWMAAVSEGGMALCGGIPVLQNFYACMKRLSQDAKVSKLHLRSISWKMAFMSRGMSRRFEVSISSNVRFSFWLATGITPDMQCHLEDYYDTFDRQYSFKKYGVVDSIPCLN